MRRLAGMAALFLASALAGCFEPRGGATDAGARVGVCTDGQGHLRPAGWKCRPAAGPCDQEEVCTGLSPDCPEDALVSAGTTCRAKAGECDIAEVCSGSSAECPPDGLLPEGAVCRDAAGPCDRVERCAAGSAQCPPDGMWGTDVICRPAVADCDGDERCTGLMPQCPADQMKPAGAACRDAADPCDAPEFCTGKDLVCPPDARLATGAACGPTSICDGIECVKACFIDGIVRQPDDVDPAQLCRICVPSQSTTAWSATDGKACTGTGVCAGPVCESDPQNALWPPPPESPTDYQVDADTVLDRVTGLTWQRTPWSSDMPFEEAEPRCKALSLGGFASGWRVPALIELLSIVDSGAASAPAINTTAFPGTVAGAFWSSTAGNQTVAGQHWGVDFATGGAFRDQYPALLSNARLRCVHSELQPLRTRFTAGAETVKDEVTGLTWERWPAAKSGTFLEADAVAYCQSLATDGGGWRLPRKKELESLQDRRSKEQAIDAVFGTAGGICYWTSTAWGKDDFWTIGFLAGSVGCEGVGGAADARCVK